MRHASTWADPPFGIVDPVVLDRTYDPPLRGFIVTGEGNVHVVMVDDSTGTFPLCSPGTVYGGMISKITASGTTATGIKGFI